MAPLAAPLPAFAGGGAGMTLAASMEGQDHELLVGTQHLVSITVTDAPGEASLRNLRVSLADLDPHIYTVTCDGGTNGALALEPQGATHCTATVAALPGPRTLMARADADVPGDGSLTRSAPLHYTGFTPPPPPPPPDPPAPRAALPAVVNRPAAASPVRDDPPRAVAAPHVGPPAAPVAAPAAPAPAAPVLAAPPAANVPQPLFAAAGTVQLPKHTGLALTGLSGQVLGAAVAVGLALVGGGLVLIRRVARR